MGQRTTMGVSDKVPDYDFAFIFGAGASLPLLPDQQQLIPRLWDATTPPYEAGLPIHLLLPARQYLARTFPGLPKGSNVSFEDVVGPLEISESEEYWFHYAYKDPRGRLITNLAVLDVTPRGFSLVECFGGFSPADVQGRTAAKIVNI